MNYAFFGLQVVIKAFRNDPLRSRIHEVIAGSTAEQSLAEKRAFYKRLTGVLNEAMPVFEMGFWDLVRGVKAEGEFENWCSEIEGTIATEKEELGAAADEVNRLSSEKDHMIVTLLFLVEADSNSDHTLGERCDLPEKDYWTRQTFAHLLATIPMLSFATVQADAVYLVPGNEEDGLSSDDLHSEGYEYLHELG